MIDHTEIIKEAYQIAKERKLSIKECLNGGLYFVNGEIRTKRKKISLKKQKLLRTRRINHK